MNKMNDQKIKNLVVDSAGFLKRCPLQDLGENIYTLPEVVSEIKDSATRQSLQVLPYELLFKQPSHEAIHFVTEFSKKSGDYPTLSATDLKVLALTYQLGKEFLNCKEFRSEPNKRVITNVKKNQNVAALPGFCAPSEDEDGWISTDNLDKIKTEMKMDQKECKSPSAVACLTTDFAMQNVLMQIGLPIISTEGYLIKETRTFILRCFSCYKTTSNMTKVFCPQCGNKTLKKVSTSISADGEQVMHLSFRKPINVRGTKFSLPMPKGGKHATNPLLVEDQRLPQQRMSNMAREKLNILDDDYVAGSSPFKLNDVYSRSANLGIHHQQAYFNRRNPNEVKKT